MVVIFVVILLLLFVSWVLPGGDEGGEGNPPRPVLDHSCTERRLASVSQSSENVELDADTRGGCLTRAGNRCLPSFLVSWALVIVSTRMTICLSFLQLVRSLGRGFFLCLPLPVVSTLIHICHHVRTQLRRVDVPMPCDSTFPKRNKQQSD